MNKLDVREMAPRDRHQTIFERLSVLEAGEALTLINDHDPVPLRYQLDAEKPGQFSWTYHEAGPERWIVDITCMARVFDARPLLAAGTEPFESIMAEASQVEGGSKFVLYAPFEPAPLRKVLGEKGFTYEAEQLEEGNWRVVFSRN